MVTMRMVVMRIRVHLLSFVGMRNVGDVDEAVFLGLIHELVE